MVEIGFPRPRMREEKRIALLPRDITRSIEHPERLFLESGYGDDYGLSDRDYQETGANIVDSSRAYSLEVLCQPKFCENDLPNMGPEVKTIFGWLHLDKADTTTEILVNRSISAIAWELMKKNNRKIFWLNGVLTGQVGVTHAMPYAGKSPKECYVAIIGRKRVGQAAISQLRHLGVKNIEIYHTENSHTLKNDLPNFDVIVNCACSDTEILSADDLKLMKKDALIIDIGGDCIGRDLYRGQSIYSPVTHINNGRNPVYCINHVPTLVYKTATRFNSRVVAPYIDQLLKGKMDQTLRNAIAIDHGRPILERL